MSSVKVDFSRITGNIKPMHAVNNGPVKNSFNHRENFGTYKALNIPYARNHDASFYSGYGGEHTVDVHSIFTDFSKDPYDAESYDFHLTDEYLQTIADAGTETFYRLGTKIEHWSKKYAANPPADPYKWAVICEHIIRHFNEGWANGKYLGITYWEIWNEPDGEPNWTGTPEQYYQLYDITSRHLKKCFPDIKIGGPALSFVGHIQWAENFLKYLKRDGNPAPLDFFSWHCYGYYTEKGENASIAFRELLNREGYSHTESILNEWNYLEGWSDEYLQSVEYMISMRGASYLAAFMSAMQKKPVDMLMYYDARPCLWNGLFDYYTLKPLKGYYSIKSFSELYQLKNEVFSKTDDDNIYVTAATDGTKKAVMVTYYCKDKNINPKSISFDFDNQLKNCYILDKNNNLEKRPFTEEVYIRPETVLLLTNYDI